MKSIRIFTKGLVIIIFFFLIMYAEEKNNSWDFPIKPGTSVWKQYRTHAEKVKALQVPLSVLKNMSTDHLVEICLTYPFLDEIWAYNNIQNGFEYVVKDFNGLQELLMRKDVGPILLLRYKNMSPNNVSKDWSLLQQGTHTAKFRHIEILIAQETILTALKDNERLTLLNEVVKKHQTMSQTSIFGYPNAETNTFLMGRILQKNDDDKFNQIISNNKKIDVFLKSGNLFVADLVQEIFSYAEQYLDIKR